MSSKTDRSKAAPAGDVIGRPRTRIDGPAKVTGRARYPSYEPTRDAAYAFLLTSAVACGRGRHIHTEDALAIDGVLDVLTHWNAGSEAGSPQQQSGGNTTTTLET
jgi:xanthine dehydrogenase YagR molybdenum-binding subunit